jgi:hypothetical protein
VILPKLLSDNLSDVPEDDFVRETKIVPREKNTVKEALKKVTILTLHGNHVGKRR